MKKTPVGLFFGFAIATFVLPVLIFLYSIVMGIVDLGFGVVVVCADNGLPNSFLGLEVLTSLVIAFLAVLILAINIADFIVAIVCVAKYKKDPEFKGFKKAAITSIVATVVHIVCILIAVVATFIMIIMALFGSYLCKNLLLVVLLVGGPSFLALLVETGLKIPQCILANKASK